MEDKFRIDSQKLIFHPARVTQLLNGKDDWELAKDIYPIYIEVSPVGACNHACSFCAIDYVLEANREAGKFPQLDPWLYSTRIAEMGVLGVRSVMFAGEGEPLLHKDINHIVNTTIAAGVDVSFTTNGTLLHKLDLQGVSWVKVSVNAGTSETYAKVHRTKEKDWGTVWDNIRSAAARKGDCSLGVQMVLLPENQHEAPLLQKMCDDAGVDYLVLKPFSQHKFSTNRQYEKFIPIMPAGGTKAVVRSESIETTEIPYDKCHATPYLWSYLMANGDLYSCSAYLLDPRFNLGNLNANTFQEIWRGEKRRANWEFVRNGLDIHECRINCRMDKSNRYLDELINGVPHRNFI